MKRLLHWLNGWRWAIHHARRAELLEAELSDALYTLQDAIRARFAEGPKHGK